LVEEVIGLLFVGLDTFFYFIAIQLWFRCHSQMWPSTKENSFSLCR